MATQRIDIGFIGGQVLTVRLDENALKSLRKSLERDAGWHDLDSEDGQVELDLTKVAYMKLDSGEHKVGFITES